METICPRCHGNGLIERVKLTNPEVEFNVCDECEACWGKNEAITMENFKFLDRYLKQLGATEDSKLEVLGYLEKKR